MPRTSDKADQIVKFVNTFIQENGYSPSVREIGAAVGLRSTASVSYHIQALQEKGLLAAGFREGNHKEIHLCITPQALPVVEDGLSAQETFGRRLFSGFSAQEGELCQQLYRRICQNAREGLEENEDWNS